MFQSSFTELNNKIYSKANSTMNYAGLHQLSMVTGNSFIFSMHYISGILMNLTKAEVKASSTEPACNQSSEYYSNSSRTNTYVPIFY